MAAKRKFMEVDLSAGEAHARGAYGAAWGWTRCCSEGSTLSGWGWFRNFLGFFLFIRRWSEEQLRRFWLREDDDREGMGYDAVGIG
jgi:hypothetical protein